MSLPIWVADSTHSRRAGYCTEGYAQRVPGWVRGILADEPGPQRLPGARRRDVGVRASRPATVQVDGRVVGTAYLKPEMESRAIAAQSDGIDASQSSESHGVGPIQACVRETLVDYFAKLNGYECLDLYRMVLEEVELPLLQVVMAECGGNQSKAARLLGINRGTLRKKLRQYGLEE